MNLSLSAVGATLLAGALPLLALAAGLPRSQQARMAATEGAVIADLRDIVAATQAYKASNGALPSSLRCLGDPVGGPYGTFPAGTRPFLDPLRGAVAGTPGVISDSSFQSRGYTFTYVGGSVGEGQYDFGVRTFTLTANPQVVGQSGHRFFEVDHTGTICESTSAAFGNDGVSVPAGCTKV